MTLSRELAFDECVRLLRAGVVGRVAITTPDGPHIIPINYSVVDDAIVVATSPYSALGTYGDGIVVAFEIDRFDYETHTGWSVVVRGRAQAVTDPDELRRLNAELRATRALLGESVRVNERTRISRELHDLLGHHLTALSLNLEVAGHLSEGRVKEHVQQAHTLARLLLTDVREAVSQLREGGAIDLAAALLPLAENVPAVDIHMDIETPLTLDDPERAHVLLRCTQEIITNAVRHAGGRNLWIHARRDCDCILVTARDDGQGADNLVAGNGLRGMRERLQQHGGDLKIETRPGAGFSLQLTLPVSAAAAAARQGAIA